MSHTDSMVGAAVWAGTAVALCIAAAVLVFGRLLALAHRFGSRVYGLGPGPRLRDAAKLWLALLALFIYVGPAGVVAGCVGAGIFLLCMKWPLLGVWAALFVDLALVAAIRRLRRGGGAARKAAPA